MELYTVPAKSVTDSQQVVQNNADDPLAYLTLAKAFWQENKMDDGMTALSQGLAVEENPVKYLLSAAATADELSQTNLAILLYMQALGWAEKLPSVYPAVRNLTGEYLYAAALQPDSINSEAIRQMASNLQPTVPMPAWMLDVMAARGLIAANRVRLAEGALRRLPPADRNRAEVYLVRGELLRAQNRRDSAIDEWQTIATLSDAPDWVKTRAAELLQLLGA